MIINGTLFFNWQTIQLCHSRSPDPCAAHSILRTNCSRSIVCLTILQIHQDQRCADCKKLQSSSIVPDCHPKPKPSVFQFSLTGRSPVMFVHGFVALSLTAKTSSHLVISLFAASLQENFLLWKTSYTHISSGSLLLAPISRLPLSSATYHH